MKVKIEKYYESIPFQNNLNLPKKKNFRNLRKQLLLKLHALSDTGLFVNYPLIFKNNIKCF